MTFRRAVSNNTVSISASCLVVQVDKCFEVMMTGWCLEVTGRNLSVNLESNIRTEFLAMRVSVFVHGNSARFAVTFTVFAYGNSARLAMTFTVFAQGNSARFAVTFTVFAYGNSARLAMTFTVFAHGKNARLAVTFAVFAQVKMHGLR